MRGSPRRRAFNGFKPPVSFNVSSDGKRLLGFKYSAGDCGGMGGPGDPWIHPEFVRKVGTIKVDSKGNFSVKNAKWKVVISGSNPPVTKYSYSSVSGHFKTARKATGTITLKVKIGSGSCPPKSGRSQPRRDSGDSTRATGRLGCGRPARGMRVTRVGGRSPGRLGECHEAV